jgi:hypothetical protein
MDDVLGAALAMDDVRGFLREGDHIIDEIFEGAPSLQVPPAEAPAQVGVN